MRAESVLALACTGCVTYAQHQVGLVPHAVPVQTIGEQAAWRGTTSLGASNIADFASPEVGDPRAGVAVPSKQLRGSLGVAITRDFGITMFREYGLASSAEPIKSTLPPLGDEPVIGDGYTATYSVPTGLPFRFAFTIEAVGWKVPWVQHSTCIENCSDVPLTSKSVGTHGVLGWAVGIVPSYQLDDWTFFGGCTMRSHPTLDEKVVNHGESPWVETGPTNVLFHAGVAYEADDRVKFVIELHHDAIADPVAYAPGVGFSTIVGLGPRFSRDERRATGSP